MFRTLLIVAICLFGSTVMAKTYVGRIVLKGGTGQSIPVQTEANSPKQAKTIIEAQFAGRIKRWFTNPSPKR